MRHFPASVRVALLLLALDALLWFAFGVVVACGGIASINHPPVLRWGMAGLALASAASLGGIALLLSRRSRPAFFFAISLLAIIVVLSITDQIGLADLVALAVSAVPLGLLLKDRAWYLRKTNAAGGATMDDRADHHQDPP
jgi:hypothetical protein